MSDNFTRKELQRLARRPEVPHPYLEHGDEDNPFGDKLPSGDELERLAKQHPAPQEWYDECDSIGLTKAEQVAKHIAEAIGCNEYYQRSLLRILEREYPAVCETTTFKIAGRPNSGPSRIWS